MNDNLTPAELQAAVWILSLAIACAALAFCIDSYFYWKAFRK